MGKSLRHRLGRQPRCMLFAASVSSSDATVITIKRLLHEKGWYVRMAGHAEAENAWVPETFDLIIVDQDVSSGTYGGKYKLATIPTLIMEGAIDNQHGFAENTPTNRGVTDFLDHPITRAAGLVGLTGIAPYATGGIINSVNVDSDAVSVSVHTASGEGMVLAAERQLHNRHDDIPFPKRSVLIPTAADGTFTEEFERLIAASIDWLTDLIKPKLRFALLAPQHELIESPRVWTKQPPAGTPIDRSNVIGKHITSVMVPTGFGVYEAASQSIIQYGNTDVSYHGSKLGLVGESTLVDTSGWDLPTEVYPPTGNSDRTFCAFIKPILPASPAGLITSHGQNTTGNRWSFKIQDDSGHLRIEIEGSGYTTSVLTVANDVWQCVGCALKGTTLGGHTLHVDERSESASGGNAVNTATISSGGDPSRLFGDSHGLGGGNTGIKSQVAIAAWFDSGEPWIYEEFLRNPWQIFKAPMLIVPKDIVGPPIAIVERPW